ncbi:hypothetical protein A3D07_01040 [Candidatus Curtissbacteria bacterium RIFCSPHIGHO2_02_FULL_42_15]|uniref:Uncharacterized protein n=1 Tax=Candidatus Curtissbacteria bacterium RIFCSPHIGHO2_02_FULL_42_15 TaxID=1797716 RepID=A0A1F5GG13_9BACT|nr:MAG: hypothetical protein A3D07_01040 [Candidatus Curtissbacteria bacterium RIFCSPHIGHO2_02_FULL_42_15]
MFGISAFSSLILFGTALPDIFSPALENGKKWFQFAQNTSLRIIYQPCTLCNLIYVALSEQRETYQNI